MRSPDQFEGGLQGIGSGPIGDVSRDDPGQVARNSNLHPRVNSLTPIFERGGSGGTINRRNFLKLPVIVVGVILGAEFIAACQRAGLVPPATSTPIVDGKASTAKAPPTKAPEPTSPPKDILQLPEQLRLIPIDEAIPALIEAKRLVPNTLTLVPSTAIDASVKIPVENLGNGRFGFNPQRDINRIDLTLGPQAALMEFAVGGIVKANGTLNILDPNDSITHKFLNKAVGAVEDRPLKFAGGWKDTFLRGHSLIWYASGEWIMCPWLTNKDTTTTIVFENNEPYMVFHDGQENKVPLKQLIIEFNDPDTVSLTYDGRLQIDGTTYDRMLKDKGFSNDVTDKYEFIIDPRIRNEGWSDGAFNIQEVAERGLQQKEKLAEVLWGTFNMAVRMSDEAAQTYAADQTQGRLLVASAMQDEPNFVVQMKAARINLEKLYPDLVDFRNCCAVVDRIIDKQGNLQKYQVTHIMVNEGGKITRYGVDEKGELKELPLEPVFHEYPDKLGFKNGCVMTYALFDIKNQDPTKIPEVVRQRYLDVIRKSNNLAVISDAVGWSGYEPERGEINSGGEWYIKNQAERLWDMGIRNIRGHSLVYPKDTPAWLREGVKSDAINKDELRQILDAHIKRQMSIMSGSSAKITEWVVVNEPYRHWSGDDDFLHTALGDEYIDFCFQSARTADSKAKLIFNDTYNHTSQPVPASTFGTVQNETTGQTKKIVERLKEKGLIDAVGLQMHLDGANPPDWGDVVVTMRSYGVPVEITEFDVDMRNVSGTEEKRRAIQAEIYASALNAALISGVCRGFSCWDIGDKYSWTETQDNSSSKADATPFDDNMDPKPAYKALLDTYKKYLGLV